MSNIGTFTKGELTMTDEHGSTTFEVGSVELHALDRAPPSAEIAQLSGVVSFTMSAQMTACNTSWSRELVLHDPSRRRRALRLARRIRRAKHGWRT